MEWISSKAVEVRSAGHKLIRSYRGHQSVVYGFKFKRVRQNADWQTYSSTACPIHCFHLKADSPLRVQAESKLRVGPSTSFAIC